MEQKLVTTALTSVGNLVSLANIGEPNLWVNYDKEADVLYISFGKPQKADDSIQEKGIIKRTKGKKLVGLTILNATRFASKKN